LNFIELEGLEEAKELFGEKKFKKAQKRAITKAVDKGYTELSRRITSKWNIKKKDLKPTITKKVKTGEYPSGELTARSRPLSRLEAATNVVLVASSMI